MITHTVNNNYLKIFENCQITLGYKKAIIYDLQRGKSFNVPLFTKHLLDLFRKKTISEVFKEYENDSSTFKIISEYFNFFLKNEICFEVSKLELKLFPKLNDEWDYPSLISSCILKLNKTKLNEKYLSSLGILINSLKINYLLLEINDINITHLNKIFKLIDKTTVFHLDISFINGIENENYLKTLEENLSFKVHSIFIYNQKIKKTIVKKTYKTIFVNTSYNNILELKNKSFYPLIDYSFFNYFESHNYNLFYNRKIIIEDNFIKESKESVNGFELLSNISSNEHSLKLLNNKRLTQYWEVGKDKIDVCKNCELRYFCLDDRTPKKRIKDSTWYYSSECQYNPYIAKWKSEIGYKSLSECGIVSNEDGFQLNKRKLNSINNVLWG